MIVGPGALGGYFAARLAQRFPHVWVLDHRPARAQQLQEHGFHVTGASFLDWVPPDGRISAAPRGWPKMDVVFLMVKAPVLAKAAAQAKRLAGPKSFAVCLQNGWGYEKAAQKVWNARRLVWGFTREAVTEEVPGRLFHAASGATCLDGKSPHVRDAAALLERAGFQARVERNFQTERWMKFLVNACINPLAALAGVPNGRLREPPLAPLLDKIMEECAAGSAHLGRRVAVKELRAAVSDVLTATAANKNSMLQDLLRGRATERGFLLGPLLSAKGRVATLAYLDRLLAKVETTLQKVP